MKITTGDVLVWEGIFCIWYWKYDKMVFITKIAFHISSFFHKNKTVEEINKNKLNKLKKKKTQGLHIKDAVSYFW